MILHLLKRIKLELEMEVYQSKQQKEKIWKEKMREVHAFWQSRARCRGSRFNPAKWTVVQFSPLNKKEIQKLLIVLFQISQIFHQIWNLFHKFGTRTMNGTNFATRLATIN